jgi:RHS repeat-associated protein
MCPTNSDPPHYAYTYDIDGKQTQEVRTGGSLATRTTSYTYDNLGRLSQVTLPGGTCRKYLFDLDSNRSSIQESSSGCGGTFSTTASYVYDTQRLDQLQSVTQGQTTSFGYTPDGQVSTRGADTLTWDGRGRLSGGTFAGSNLSYEFDATGFRRQRNVVPSPIPRTRRYLLGGLFERDGSNNLLQSDIDGPSGDLAHFAGAPTSSTTVSYLYYSGHGDLAAEASALGARTAAYTYDPFGAPNESVPDSTTTERWTGRWNKKLDTTTSLIEMGARPYDPSLGRFLAVDPVDGGSLNNYDYAGQDPVRGFDLDGRIWCGGSDEECGGGGGGGEADEGEGRGGRGGGRGARGSNPYGRRGSPAHRNMIARIERRFWDRGWGTESGGSLLGEEGVRINGKLRYPDLVMGKGDRRIAFQVGCRTKGGLPAWRERAPLADLRASGRFTHVFFIAFRFC